MIRRKLRGLHRSLRETYHRLLCRHCRGNWTWLEGFGSGSHVRRQNIRRAITR